MGWREIMNTEKISRIKALASAIDRFLYEDEEGDSENALILSGMLIEELKKLEFNET